MIVFTSQMANVWVLVIYFVEKIRKKLELFYNVDAI